MTEHQQRWQGRNQQKDELREAIWLSLEESGAGIGSPWSAIPNFTGAEQAAFKITSLSAWQEARVVKCNPDGAQGWLRKMALEQGKRVYMAVPELAEDFPFILLDPVALKERGIAPEQVMFAKQAIAKGQPVAFKNIEPLDFVVVGSVAVTRAGGRIGKGAGFADLELGLFRLYGVVNDETPIVTTVHNLQLVDDGELVMQAHDTPLDWIALPGELIATNTKYPIPGPLDWASLQPDQFETIPFLNKLQQEFS